MAAPVRFEGLPSLLGITIRRSIVLGRVFLGIGILYSVLVSIGLAFTAVSSLLAAIGVFLPIFAVVGGMGGLMVFTNDRLKGVFEYLIAYGVPPRRLFTDVLVASLVLVTIVLGVSLAVALGLDQAEGHGISPQLAEFLGLYTIPMSYATSAFAAIVGMYWTSLSSPRAGISSPVGVVPLIGIAPPLILLGALVILGAAEGTLDAFLATITGVALVTVVVLLLLSLVERMLPRERLLSPA